MTFAEQLKQTQKQVEIDKKVFKKTGVMSGLLMRIENFNRGQK